jgi:hypothetical protein
MGKGGHKLRDFQAGHGCQLKPAETQRFQLWVVVDVCNPS